MKTPVSVHDFKTRSFPDESTQSKQEWSVKWGSYNWVYVSASLQGKYIGALEMGNGIWRVFYRNVFLGYFNENELRTKEQS
tara:strand:+ start:1391 stop:1633 length:243 start_codon:yes stop_codon:yes gene_type:complete